MKYCMIETALDNKEELDQIIEQLLNKRLVASCQVVKSSSKWNWNNQKEEATEYLLLMKTMKTLTEEIYQVIKSIHSYECFEFAVFDLTSCNDEYLKWIEGETK